MADRRWVVNASPLIVLAKIGRLQLLESLAELEVPNAVRDEVERAGPDDAAASWLSARRHSFVDVAPDPRVLAWDLGAGETAVLSRVLENGGEAIIDDRAARKCAAALGVSVRGTLSVLVLAKAAGLVAEVAPMLRELRHAGMFLESDVERRALELAGESDS